MDFLLSFSGKSNKITVKLNEPGVKDHLRPTTVQNFLCISNELVLKGQTCLILLNFKILAVSLCKLSRLTSSFKTDFCIVLFLPSLEGHQSSG